MDRSAGLASAVSLGALTGRGRRSRCSRGGAGARRFGRLVLGVAVAAVVTGSVAVPRSARAQETPAAAPATQPAKEAIGALSDRLADVAAEFVQSGRLSTSRYRQAAAFLEAASRLSPSEPRFHRLRYEALIQAGDTQGAIEALVSYARLDPTDLQAQARIIELYAQRMETADEKLKYLQKDILATGTIPAEIRSHAAVLASRVLLERGERTAATAMAVEAARLNPVNREAQQLRFDLSLRNGTPVDRLTGLLAIVRASPLDLGAVVATADEISRAGIDESVGWYDAALGLAVRNGTPPPREMVNNYAARLFLAGQTTDAEGLINRVLAGDPTDVSAHFIRLSIERVQGNPAEVETHKALARTAFTNRLAEIARAAGDANATTRPSDDVQLVPPPDPIATAQRVEQAGDPGLRAGYIDAASDLAFLYLFFLEQPGPAGDLIAGLKRVLPADSPVLARLEGWYFLVRKQDAEARQKLSAVADRDPLASLGLVRLDSAGNDTKEAADTRARGLRSADSHGVVGAIIFSELQPRKTPLVLSPVAEQLNKLLEKFPRRVLSLIDSPQSFYFLRAEPVQGSVPYGSPLLVKVSLINASDLELSMGPQGAVRNDVFCDVQVRGMRPQSFPAVAFDTLAGPLVLRPRQVASRVVRIDRGKLLVFLRSTPYSSVPMSGSVSTNPAVVNGRVGYGAGGYEVQFNRVMEQQPVPIVQAEQRKALIEGLSSAPPEKRLPLIDAAVVYYSALVAQASPDQQEVPARLRALIDALASDPEPTARSWGTFWGLLLSKGDARPALARTASFDPYWLVRMLALAGLRGTDADTYRRLATQLSADPDATVARFAKASLDELENAAASGEPASQPAATPAPGAAPEQPSTTPPEPGNK